MPKPTYWPLLLLGVVGFVWLLGGLAEVMVVQQYTLVLMIPLLVWSILGTKIALELVFPLLFLLFAVPFGEIFLPPMMAFTADFTVAALQLSNIPVYREGLFFTIPSGQWSVVEACSGLRYLIASLTLGCLYAYLTYRSVWRRSLFILLSVVVPVIANGLRAYMIVMIGHLSDMQLAVGVDHYIYGWVFFGLVMILLFWVGSFWREDGNEDSANPTMHQTHGVPVPLRGVVIVAVLAMTISALWPSYAAHLKNTNSAADPSALGIPSPANGWEKRDQMLIDWVPHFLNPRVEINQIYQKGDSTVGLFIGYYRNQHQGAELIGSQNAIVTSTNAQWGKIGEEQRTVVVSGRDAIPATQTRLRGPETRLLTWHWFWVEGRYVSNPYMAKFLEAKSRLFGKGDDAAVIVIYTPYQDTIEAPVEALKDFLNTMQPAIDKSLADANRD